MKDTLEVINRMQSDGVITKYAIGGAVGAIALQTGQPKDHARIPQFLEQKGRFRKAGENSFEPRPHTKVAEVQAKVP